MKKRQKNDFREKSEAELKKVLAERQKKLMTAKIEEKLSRPKDIFSLGKLRQEIAIVKTILRERKFGKESL